MQRLPPTFPGFGTLGGQRRRHLDDPPQLTAKKALLNSSESHR
jgi:hypothetical protein